MTLARQHAMLCLDKNHRDVQVRLPLKYACHRVVFQKPQLALLQLSQMPFSRCTPFSEVTCTS